MFEAYRLAGFEKKKTPLSIGFKVGEGNWRR
jgi:hypothetical protein